MNIGGCIELEKLHPIETLVSLRELNAIFLKKLKIIGAMGQVRNLWFINVNRCSKLEKVESIQHCMSLNVLSTNYCVKLKNIQKINFLAKLRWFNVKSSKNTNIEFTNSWDALMLVIEKYKYRIYRSFISSTNIMNKEKHAMFLNNNKN